MGSVYSLNAGFFGSSSSLSDSVGFFLEVVAQNRPAVLVVMTVNTKILPVGAVRGIVHMVSVFVMNGQQMTVLIPEFSSAFGAHEPVDPERLFSVIV